MKKTFKVTVYGGTNNKSYSKKEIADCEKLGLYLAGINAEVLTGACKGLPYYTGKATAQAGGKVIGYTPALNEKEHIGVYKFPMDGVTDMVYTKNKGAHNAENFMRRSWDMTPFSDVVVALGGSWGTFMELMFSFFYKKTIILVSSFGGAVKAFENAYKFFGSRDVNPDVHNGPNIIKVKNVDAAIKEIEKLRVNKA